MKKCFYIFFLIFLFGCREKEPETFFSAGKATMYFKKVEEICNRDSGRLWGRNLYGPMMFVDRKSRKINANKPDKENILKLKDGVYTGLYPRENLIRNATAEFGGTTYAVTPLPEKDDEYRIISRSIRGLFHQYQHSLGINFTAFNVPEMDEKEARLWLKLEWRALKKAIETDGEEKALAIRDALIFREVNHQMFPKSLDLGNQFETYEGLATFTYTLFMSESFNDYKTKLLEYLDKIYQYQSYSRSYGFIHGALYATLLYEKGFDFKSVTTGNLDLAKIVKEVYNVELPLSCRDVAGSVAVNYNIDEIFREEEKRLLDVKEKLHKQISLFTDKSVVFLELESPSFDFEPEDVHSLDTLGTLYNNLRVSDNWGKLSVEKGNCLVSDTYKYLRIPAKGLKIEKNHIYGDGWHIILNDNWQIGEINENYVVRKLRP